MGIQVGGGEEHEGVESGAGGLCEGEG
jgi:hypothetical protein